MEPAAKKARVHFGSLEEGEKVKRLERANADGQENVGVSAAVLAGIKAGNINISNGWCALYRSSLE